MTTLWPGRCQATTSLATTSEHLQNKPNECNVIRTYAHTTLEITLVHVQGTYMTSSFVSRIATTSSERLTEEEGAVVVHPVDDDRRVLEDVL